jgi:hypothetical protein
MVHVHQPGVLRKWIGQDVFDGGWSVKVSNRRLKFVLAIMQGNW